MSSGSTSPTDLSSSSSFPLDLSPPSAGRADNLIPPSPLHTSADIVGRGALSTSSGALANAQDLPSPGSAVLTDPSSSSAVISESTAATPGIDSASSATTGRDPAAPTPGSPPGPGTAPIGLEPAAVEGEEAAPAAGPGVPPVAGGAPPFAATDTTPIATIQAQINATMAANPNRDTCAILEEVSGYLQARFPAEAAAGQINLSASMARAPSGEYRLETYDSGGKSRYCMDVTFKFTVGDEVVTVTQKIYTSATSKKEALQCIDAYKHWAIGLGIPGTRLGARGRYFNAPTTAGDRHATSLTIVGELDKKKGGYKEITGVRVGSETYEFTARPGEYKTKGRTSLGERIEGKKSYSTKSEMLREAGASRVRGGHEIHLSKIRNNELTVDKFLDDVKKRERELESLRKSSFMRFRGIVGSRESGDVALYAGFLEAKEAIRTAAGAAVADVDRWRDNPKVHAYVTAYNATVQARQEVTALPAASAAILDPLQTGVTTAEEALRARQDTLRTCQEEYTQRELAFNEAERAKDTALRALRETPLGGPGEENRAYDAANRAHREAEDRVRTARQQFHIAEGNRNRAQADVNQAATDRNQRQQDLQRATREQTRATERLTRSVTTLEEAYNSLTEKYDRLASEMSDKELKFRQAHNELTDMKAAVDALRDPAARGTINVTPEQVTELAAISAQLQTNIVSGQQLLNRLAGALPPLPGVVVGPVPL